MFKKMKEDFKKILVKDSEYDFVRDRICENNRKNIVFLCSICIVIFLVLVILGFFNIAVESDDVPVFLLALLYAIIVFLLVKVKSNQSHISTMIATYLTMGAVVFYGLVISYRSPDEYTVSFIAMMCIMSMTFVDKPLRIGISHIVVTIICVCMILMHKSDTVKIADLINVISFSILSFVGGFVTVNMKVHGYVMDKLHEEDIEKGRKRLNEIEIEAQQLLTAVKSTHDMVVSVNLTKNTYKLIGDESFVTQGDDLEGNFDEVIEIHASKVIEEHRNLYYNTFSRQGLLKAYYEGKKEVYLEYQQRDDNGFPHWLGTHTMFIESPYSTDITEITISQNIDERVHKEAEIKTILSEERDKAEQARKAKTDFLFQMSHDIRTPMNAIVGFTNFIKDSNNLDNIHQEYVPKLETASQQLLMLINDALEMSRIESGKLIFHREVQDIRQTIDNVISVMKMQAEQKGVNLLTDYSIKHPIVNCDKNHMSRVIMNLVSNAVKFTAAGGSVNVSLYEKSPSPEGFTLFELKIADTGIGMSEEFIEKVFEPFEREQSSTISGMQGTGLGLTIVKRIIDTAGDTIVVNSKQGVGTVFTINLKLRRVDSNKLEEYRNKEKNGYPKEQMFEYFKGKRILLVEDNEFNLTIAQVLLENAGFIVETATDGHIAVDKVINALDSSYYDAILMDIQMPIMNGYEATKKIRDLKDERSKTIILAVTANAFDTDKANAINAGMDGHIAKPIDIAVLYQTLWDILHQ